MSMSGTGNAAFPESKNLRKPKKGNAKAVYYIYEFEMPQEMADQFERVAAERGLTTDELFCRTLGYYINHPEELKKLKDEFDGQPEVVKIVRQYPVMDGESEAEAKLRALKEKQHNAG